MTGLSIRVGARQDKAVVGCVLCGAAFKLKRVIVRLAAGAETVGFVCRSCCWPELRQAVDAAKRRVKAAPAAPQPQELT
jgi:hypothetical protein